MKTASSVLWTGCMFIDEWHGMMEVLSSVSSCWCHRNFTSIYSFTPSFFMSCFSNALPSASMKYFPYVFEYPFLGLKRGQRYWTTSGAGRRGQSSYLGFKTNAVYEVVANPFKMLLRGTTAVALVALAIVGPASGWKECTVQMDDQWVPAAPRGMSERFLMDYDRRYTCAFRPGSSRTLFYPSF